MRMPAAWIPLLVCVQGLAQGAAQHVAPDVLRLRIRVDSRMSAMIGTTPKSIVADTGIDYTCRLAATRRTVQVDRLVTQVTIDGRLRTSVDMTQERFIGYDGGRRRDVRFDDADETLQTRLAALGVPLYAVTLGPDGTELTRRTIPTRGAREALADGVLWNTRFFHPPFHGDRDSWEAERVLMGAIETTGTVRYTPTRSARTDGLIEVAVSGTLRGQGDRGGVEHRNVFEISGTQLYDPTKKEWIAGDLGVQVNVTMFQAGKRVGSGSGNMKVTLATRDRALGAGTFQIGKRQARYVRPKTWTAGSERPMRAVNFDIADRTQCYVVVLPGEAGGLFTNLDRWRRSMSMSPLTEVEKRELERLRVLGTAATIVRMDGDYEGLEGKVAAGRLLGVVCPLGDFTVFVKMIGPRDRVAANEAEFETFCRSLRFGDAPAQSKPRGAIDASSMPAKAADLEELIRAADQLLQNRGYADAVSRLDQVLAVDPNRPDVWRMRALAKGQLGDHHGAVRDAERAIDLDPESAAAYAERAYNFGMQRKWRQALADHDRAVAIAPGQAKYHGERGDVLVELREFVAAIAAYDKALALDPRWPQAWAGRGRAALALADYTAARTAFARACRLDPKNTWFLRMRSASEFASGDAAKALRTGRALMRLAPDGQAAVQRGRMAWRLGKLEDALADFMEATPAQDAGVAAETLLSAGCIQLGRGDFAAATAMLERARARSVPYLAFWILAMRWCADSATTDLARAGQQLEQACREAKLELSPTEQAILALCVRGEGDDGTADVWLGRPFEACPRLFFAAWRAERLGDTKRTDRLLARCVNTGARSWMQWATAFTLLQQRRPTRHWQASFGAEFVVASAGGATEVSVRGVTSGGAAHCQGLRAGDAIVSLAGRPIESEAWAAAIRDPLAGDDVRVEVRRNGSTRVVYLRAGIGSAD